MDLQFDKAHLWHPYTSMNQPLPVLPVVSANGSKLTLQNGKELIDGMSSWWTAIHGYNHPVLNQALFDQTEKMAHIMFGGITHEPAIELGKLLVEITPKSLTNIFYADSGSVSVEVAMKMAIQYWYSNGNREKSKFITVKKGYHGDTFNAMAVCDPINGMHHLFSGALPNYFFAEAPQTPFGVPLEEEDLKSMVDLIKVHHKEVAAVILEPIVQGAGGMRFYSADYLNELRTQCDKYNVLLIFDEIATGFGRTGKLFATEHTAIEPDIMCIGKALTGGYLTLAATLASDKVAKGISKGEASVFMHGPTFMANPLACAVSLASVKLLLESDWNKKIDHIENLLRAGLKYCEDMEQVQNVRVLGAIGVVEMTKPVPMKEVQEMFVDLGVWVRPFGKLIYIMPPYIISDSDLMTLIDAIVEVVKKMES